MTLPDEFIERTRGLMGDDLWAVASKALGESAPVSVRLNPLKRHPADRGLTDDDGMVPWCTDGHYLRQRPNFTFDPLFHAGLYYVQEASSMFIDRVLRQHVGDEPVMALDLCAAPGGKSTAARAMLPEGSLLICNEPMRDRARVLVENMMKFGHEDVIVTCDYPRDFTNLGLAFDLIIADVPCSGEGMFRKDEAAVGEWSVRGVEKCRQLQREIVADAWKCLRPGGLLVYSTCTFNADENEDNVRHIAEELGAEVLRVDVEDSWRITGSLLDGFDKPVYRFIPGMTRGEGLFMAALRKTDGDIYNKVGEKRERARKAKRQDTTGKTAELGARWLTRPDMYDVVTRRDTVVAIPKAWRQAFDTAEKRLNVLSAGVELGEIKGRDLIPSQALALSTAVNRAAFGEMELDYAQAISYLRKETIAPGADMARGYALMTYKGVPLGFGKNVGGRINNLYPAEWRIRSAHLPDGNNEIITIKQDT